MFKNLCAVSLFVLGLFVAAPSFAGDNAILEALKDSGVETQALTSTDLNNVRGTGFVQNLTAPSYSAGIKEYHVTWKKFGSMSDYRSYNIVGASTTPGAGVGLGNDTSGNKLLGVGDVWMADTKSNQNSWNRANATVVEYHLNVMVEAEPNSGQYYKTNIGYTDSGWNRPLSTFNW